MPEYKTYKDLWKYCTSDQYREMLLSLKLFGNTEWTGEKQISCLYALSNHVEKHYHRVKIPKSSGGVRFLDVPDPLLKQVQKTFSIMYWRASLCRRLPPPITAGHRLWQMLRFIRGTDWY